jgi:hypothetical protein
MYKYKAIKINGVKKDEHRFIWETYYGEIPKNMVIHHINGNSRDNNIDNLKLMSLSEHSRFHMTGKVNSHKKEITHGTSSGYRRGCRCIDCKNHAKIRMKIYRYKKFLNSLPATLHSGFIVV